MRRLVIAIALVGWCAPMSLLTGCDKTREEQKTVEVKDNGTTVTQEKKVTESPNGTVTKTEEKKVSNP